MCFTVCFDTQEQYFLVPYDENNLRVAARHNLAHLILYLKLPPQYIPIKTLKSSPPRGALHSQSLCPALEPFNYQRVQSLPRSTRYRSFPNFE
jgi:hypothetical protein